MWRMYSVRPYIPSECADRASRLLKQVEELTAEVNRLKEELDRRSQTY